MELTRTERAALSGFAARDRIIYHEHIEPLRREYQEFFDEVTDRLGLERGAIGRTHEIGPDGRVAERRAPEPVAAE